MFSDSFNDEPKPPTIIHSRNTEREEDDLPLEDIPVMQTISNEENTALHDKQEDNFTSNDDFIHNPEISPLISENELEALKNELAEYKEKIDGYKAHAEEMEALKLTVEKALMERDKQLETANTELETLKNTLPDQLAASKEEGRQAGMSKLVLNLKSIMKQKNLIILLNLMCFIKMPL